MKAVAISDRAFSLIMASWEAGLAQTVGAAAAQLLFGGTEAS